MAIERLARTALAVGAAAIALAASWAAAGGVPPTNPSAAEAIYSASPERLLQIRTIVASTGRQSSIGSGFLADPDGLVITNYHVVSQVALEPKTYRLEFVGADGSRGNLTLLAIDLPNDLAVVRLEKHGAPYFAFDERAKAGALPKGERLFSMGNPLDLGFTINEGTYNGLVEHSYGERMHFTGALNPGMSGGPTVTAAGLVVGINVAKRLGGDLVSFLVPARFAVALLDQVRAQEAAAPQDFRADIARQLTGWQAGLYASLSDEGFRSTALGPYEVPEPALPWFECWARTNDGVRPKPRASVNSTTCSGNTGLFVASDLTIGAIQVTHSHVSTADLNQFQFASFLTQMSQSRVVVIGASFRKWYTPERCHEDFMAAAAATAGHPPLRVVWCAQAYREFNDLYDVALTAVTEDHGKEALVSRLGLRAVEYDKAVALSQRFLENVRTSK
ncbi:MAG TPA: serine protease [Xanthobacteraceae bacterium]|jgi:S1-C subfamily serine protease